MITNDEYRSLLNGIISSLSNRVSVTIDKDIPDAPTGSIPTVDALDDLVRKVIETPNPQLTAELANGLDTIPFRYIYNGCFARAHIMNGLLGNNGFDNAKLFAYGSLAARND